eukprot:scaffold316_cov352-Pavlova_lutheri.AAC.22
MDAFFVACTAFLARASSAWASQIDVTATNACEAAYESLDGYCTPRWACEQFCVGSCVALAGAGSNGCPLLQEDVIDNPDGRGDSPVPTCCIDCRRADVPGTCEALDASAQCTSRHDCESHGEPDEPQVWDAVHFCGNKVGATGSCGCCVASDVYQREVCALVVDEGPRSCSSRGGNCTTLDQCMDHGQTFLKGLCNKHYPLCGCCLSA